MNLSTAFERTTEIYDPVSDFWEMGIELPYPAYGHCMGSLGNNQYMVIFLI